MSKQISSDKLKSCLYQRIPVKEMWNSVNDLTPFVDLSNQRKILEHASEIVPYNAFYIKTFLKKYIDLIESSGNEVSEELYELYCSDIILRSVELGPTDSDILKYCICNSINEKEWDKNSIVTIKETPRLISGNNTTGLRTWEAALFLSNYLNSSKYNLKDQTILELGAGTGLVGLALIKYYHKNINEINRVIFTDGSGELIDNLNDTFKLNNIIQNSKDLPIIQAQQLLWGTTNKASEDYSQDPPKGVDFLIGADITYDSRIVNLLCSTIYDFFLTGTKMAVISATIRNEDTIESWESELSHWFRNDWKVVNQALQPHHLDYNCWFNIGTPEIRIYEIKNSLNKSPTY